MNNVEILKGKTTHASSKAMLSFKNYSHNYYDLGFYSLDISFGLRNKDKLYTWNPRFKLIINSRNYKRMKTWHEVCPQHGSEYVNNMFYWKASKETFNRTFNKLA